MALKILILPVIFLVWVVIVNISKAIINYLEMKPDVEKSSVLVKIIGYDGASRSKPVIIAETMSKNELAIIDYKRRFQFVAQSYIDNWVRIEFCNHCSGIFFLQIENYIYDIRLCSPERKK